MTDDERQGILVALSRWMAGDLDPAEAAALQSRLDDPAVASAWDTLSALPEALADLPHDAPPAHLDQAVLGMRPPQRRPDRLRVVAAALLGVAALAGISIALTPDPIPTVAIVRGDQIVSGRANVVASTVEVEVDGLARIEVEPVGGDVREPPHTTHGGDPMKTAIAALGGAVGGAVVTVAVLQGTATVAGAGTTPTTLSAGQTQRITVGAPTAQVRSAPIPDGETPEETIARLQGQVEALEGLVGQAQFTQAIASGQLEAHVGTPQPWPADLDPSLSPEAIQARAEAVTADMDGIELVEVDCTEYPCITVITTSLPHDDWSEALKAAAERYGEGLDGVGLSASAANFDDGQDAAVFMGLTLAADGDAKRDTEVGARTHYRSDALMEDLWQQSRDADTPEAP